MSDGLDRVNLSYEESMKARAVADTEIAKLIVPISEIHKKNSLGIAIYAFIGALAGTSSFDWLAKQTGYGMAHASFALIFAAAAFFYFRSLCKQHEEIYQEACRMQKQEIIISCRLERQQSA